MGLVSGVIDSLSQASEWHLCGTCVASVRQVLGLKAPPLLSKISKMYKWHVGHRA